MIIVHGVICPSPATLKKYGLSGDTWSLLVPQDGRCPICLLRKDRLVIDHAHVRGWVEMSDKNRASYVRGLVCSYCNFRVLRKGMTSRRLRNAATYLDRYEARRTGQSIL